MDDNLKYKTGNICRIYIKNFLTFREVEVRPKPKLNIICGGNGSGKSSILAAICICLGGKASVIGRSKEIYDYVRMGESLATLELELYVEGEINIVVRRNVDKAARKCRWQLQGEEVAVKVVMQKIEQVNIQIDSLCQFLPQDKVAAFAKMNCQELLLATQRAVGDPTLHEQHRMLCDSGHELDNLQQQNINITNEILQLEKKNARLKNVVENLEVKQNLEEEINQLQTRRAWYLYDHKRRIHQEHKEKLDQNQLELKKLLETLAPKMKELQDREKTLTLIKKMIREKTIIVTKSQQVNKRLEAECNAHKDKVNEAKRKFETECSIEKQRVSEEQDYKRQLDVLNGQLQNLPTLDEEEVSARLRELTDEISKSSQLTVRLQGKVSEMLMQRDKFKQQIKQSQKELSSLQDVTGQRMELLRRYNPDAYKATQWIQDNKDTFNGYVYPPICAMLNISSEHYARYVEHWVNQRDLVAFVCENKDDVNKLKEEMDRQGVKVNVVYSVDKELTEFQPKYKIEDIRKYGFDTYMLQCMDGPTPILRFLCQNYHIHSLPIGKNGINYTNVPPAISVFYLGNQRYTRSTSRYDGQVSTSIIPLVESTRLLKIVLDQGKIKSVTAKLEKLHQGVTKMEGLLQKIQEEEKELNENLETWRNEKRALSSRKEERKGLLQRINYKKVQLKTREGEAIDLVACKSKMAATIKVSIQEQIRTLQKLTVNIEGTGGNVSACVKAAAKGKMIARELSRLEDTLKEWRENVKLNERTIQEMEKDLDRQKIEARDALSILKARLGIVSIKEITVEIRQRFQNSSLDETEQELAEKEAHLSCLAIASAAELNEYKQGVKELERLKDKLKKIKHNLQNHQDNLEEVKKQWLPNLTALITSLNTRFSEFMSNLGYAGEITLIEEEEDFTNYGIAIKVKFRGEQRLQNLTAQRQSGGERAVCTALYLLALQSLTVAPFRCVDEINQGMDRVNERKMLQMLMETEGNEESSQYFFITPKLLPNIDYKGKVNIMVVFNSATSLSHRRLNVKRILKRVQAKHKQTAEEKRRRRRV